MDRIGRPGDDFRERLTPADIRRVCETHGLDRPETFVPEERGNENVAYHLDGRYFLAFGISDNTRRKVEVLRVFEGIPEMPTPKVLAWSEDDAELHVSYMILERCPGERLDLLWDKCGHAERLRMLEGLGHAMGRYHTVSLSVAQAKASEVSLEQWVVDAVESFRKNAANARTEAMAALDKLPERLGRIGVEATAAIAALHAHYANELPPVQADFVMPGLIRGEPCAEHFLIERDGDEFRLSGCVDLEEVMVADAFTEIAAIYAQMLGLNAAYYGAFKNGYEHFFVFPANAKERLHAAAIDGDVGSILWLLNSMEQRKEWSFATPWVEGHVRRIESWLDETSALDHALFRKDIGPW